MSEELLKQYREKRNKRNEKKIITHFTQDDSRNTLYGLRTKSNPYLLYSHLFQQTQECLSKDTTVKDCSAKEAMIRSVCSAVSSISHIVLDEMLHWFKYAFDGFYKCPNDVKNNIFNTCYDNNGNLLPHPGVTILPEIVGELSPGNS